MTLVVNLFAGPGAGKSTLAAGLFSNLKLAGVRAELVTEYAKDLVWRENLKDLDNQLYVFAKQHHRVFKLLNKVEVVVTDSPLKLSLFYGEDTTGTFKALVAEEVDSMDNLDVWVERVKPYEATGRLQSEREAREICEALKSTVSPLYTVTGDKEGLNSLTGIVLRILRQPRSEEN